MLKRIFLSFVVLLLAGCSANPPTASPVVDPATDIPQPTATATIIPTATQTPQPTVPPTPTPTPAPVLPVGALTPVPVSSQIIDSENAAQIQLLAVSSGDPSGLTVVSRDGKRAVFASPEGIEILDLAGSQLINRLDAAIAYDRFEYARGWLSAAEDTSVVGLVTPADVRVLAADGKVLYSLPNRVNEDYPSIVIMDGVGISPDGQLAAVSECAQGEYNSCPFHVIDTVTGEVIYTWNGKMLELHGSVPVFSPDGSLLATWFDNTLWFWSTKDWSKVSDLPVDEMEEWIFSPDGQTIALGGETLRTWDIAGRRLVREFTADGRQAIYPYFSADGLQVGGMDYYGKGVIWNTEDASLVGEFELGEVDPARVWLVDGQAEVVRLPGHDRDLWGGGSGDGGFTFVDGEGGLELVLVAGRGGRACRITLAGPAACTGSDYSTLGSDGQMYYGTEKDGTIEIRPTPDGSGDTAAVLPWSGFYFEFNGFDPEANLLFYTSHPSMGSSSAFVYDTEKEVVLAKIDDGRAGPVRYSPDGQYAVFAVSHNPRLDVIVFDRVNRLVAFQKTFQYGMIDSVTFTPDGQKIAVLAASNSQPLTAVQLIDIAAPHQVSQIQLDLPEVVAIRSMAFSPDGSLVAAGISDGRIQIVNASEGSLVHEWQAHAEWIDRLAFAPDGAVLASASASGYLKFWGIWP